MHYEHFEYQVVLFDLINILIIFQVYINHALYDLIDDFCIVYFDNILIFLKSEKKILSIFRTSYQIFMTYKVVYQFKKVQIL